MSYNSGGALGWTGLMSILVIDIVHKKSVQGEIQTCHSQSPGTDVPHVDGWHACISSSSRFARWRYCKSYSV